MLLQTNYIFVKEDFEKIHFVLGNESCDLDSSVSATIWAYYLHSISKTTEDKLVVAVQNVSKEDFLLRSDNCFVYKKILVDLDLLVYRDQLDIASLILPSSKKEVLITLVDHHVLPPCDDLLTPFVVQFFDHRPRNPLSTFAQGTIEQVASCCTLIAKTILELNGEFLFEELAFLLYATIIIDCDCPFLKSKKTTCCDRRIVNHLEQNFSLQGISRELLFEQLKSLRGSVAHLSPVQILRKDAKVPTEEVAVVSLPMLVGDFVELEKCCDGLQEFSTVFKVHTIVLKGGNEVGIYSKKEEFRISIVKILEKKGNYQFLKEVNGVLMGAADRVWTRKQLIPMIIEGTASMK